MWQAGFPAFFLLICSRLFHQHLTLCAQDPQKGVSEHAESDVTVPSLPGADLIVIQADLSLALFKTLLDGPTRSDGKGHLGKRCPAWGKDQHIGPISGFFSLKQTASNHQPSLPPFLLRLGKLDACPIEVTWSLASLAHRETVPLIGLQSIGEAIHALALALHLHLLLTGDRQRIRLRSRFEALAQRAMTSIDAITRYPPHRESSVQGPPQHAGSQFRFGSKDEADKALAGMNNVE